MELQDMTRSLIQSSNASNRTLALLEQERTKYQFFASMSKEIQFEYSGSSDVLTVSDWGAEQLGVSSVLVHPGRNKEIYKIFTREDFVDLRNRLSSAKPEDPIVTCTYRINVPVSYTHLDVYKRQSKYMADKRSYDRFTYEAQNSPFAKGAAEILMKESISLLNEMHENRL